MGGIRLEIGSGTNPHEGYQHLDINPKHPCIEYVASASAIPLPDNSVEDLLAINVLEHFEWTEIKAVLKEWSRVVMPGGIITIHVPDIAYIPIILHTDEWKEGVGVQPFNAAEDKWEYINHYVMSTNIKWNAHRAVFDCHTLKGLLSEVGFGNFERLPTDKRWLFLKGVKK